MVPRWRKITRKSPYQKKLLESIEQIQNGDFSGLDVVKLSGKKEIYRCRVGDMRIVFTKNFQGEFDILDIGWRGDIYK